MGENGGGDYIASFDDSSQAASPIGRIPPIVLVTGAITLGLTVALLVVCALRAGTSAKRHRAGSRGGGKYGRAGSGIAPSRQRRSHDEYDEDEDEDEDEGDAPFGYGDNDDDDDDDISDIGSRGGGDSGFPQRQQVQLAHGGGVEDTGGASILGVQSIPAIYKTADGACAIDVPLAGVSTVRGLLEAVVHLGQAMVDADVSAATIKVHYALGAGEKPTRITRDTTLWDLREATGLVVTPR